MWSNRCVPRIEWLGGRSLMCAIQVSQNWPRNSPPSLQCNHGDLIEFHVERRDRKQSAGIYRLLIMISFEVLYVGQTHLYDPLARRPIRSWLLPLFKRLIRNTNATTFSTCKQRTYLAVSASRSLRSLFDQSPDGVLDGFV